MRFLYIINIVAIYLQMLVLSPFPALHPLSQGG